jgi:ABC-type polysaccharide/polyol phosphate export permease
MENEYGRVFASVPDSAFVRITPTSVRTNSIGFQFAELWRYRRLIWVLASRNLRVRYKGSVLGIFWSMILPIVQVIVLTVVFGYFLKFGPHNMSAYMLCAFLPWIFFSASLPDAAGSVLSNLELMKKVYIPREIFPISSVVANLVHLGASMFVFIVYRYVFTTIVFLHFGPHGIVSGWPGLPPAAIFMLPLVIIDLIALTMGLSFFACAITTFAEDFKYIVQASLTILFYALPIIYFSEQIFYSPSGTSSKRSIIYHLYLLNPVAWIVTAFKQMFFNIQALPAHGPAMIHTAPFDYRYFLITTAVSFVILFLGYAYFNRAKWKFTERP